MGLLVKNYPRGGPFWFSLITFLVSLVCQFSNSMAAPGPNHEPVVQIKAEVSITTDQQMDFGQLADKDGSVTLGLADTITADPDIIHFGGSPYSGIYTLTGDPDTLVDISVTAQTSDGFSLASFISSEGNLPLIGVALNSGGFLVLTLGATLTLDSATAIVGSGQSIAFTITSTYN